MWLLFPYFPKKKWVTYNMIGGLSYSKLNKTNLYIQNFSCTVFKLTVSIWLKVCYDFRELHCTNTYVISELRSSMKQLICQYFEFEFFCF